MRLDRLGLDEYLTGGAIILAQTLGHLSSWRVCWCPLNMATRPPLDWDQAVAMLPPRLNQCCLTKSAGWSVCGTLV